MLDICLNFPISNEEFIELEEKFGKLAWHASHELKKKNTRNNFIDDPEDIKQTLTIDMLKAGSYYKRQIYLEKCLIIAGKYATDNFMKMILSELNDLWDNRTRHGANKQKYGPYQEQILENIVAHIVPKEDRPDKSENLKIDTKFARYCKAIVWNGEKSMGKKITREKGIRNNMISLSEFAYIK